STAPTSRTTPAAAWKPRNRRTPDPSSPARPPRGWPPRGRAPGEEPGTAWELERSVQLFGDLALGVGAHELIDLLAVLEEHDGGDAADAETARDLARLVGVQLGHLGLA